MWDEMLRAIEAEMIRNRKFDWCFKMDPWHRDFHGWNTNLLGEIPNPSVLYFEVEL